MDHEPKIRLKADTADVTLKAATADVTLKAATADTRQVKKRPSLGAFFCLLF